MLYADAGRALLEAPDSLLQLMLLDLEPARPGLESCYSNRRGGRPRRDPVCLLRSLVAMTMRGVTSITDWVDATRREPLLAIVCGFDPAQEAPGVGTYYDFMDRLRDGPAVRRCAHVIRETERLRGGRGRFLRKLRDEKARAKQEREAGGAEAPVRQAVERARRTASEPLPQDFTERMNVILMRCGVVESARRRLLGDTGRLDVAMDGSPLVTHAIGDGHRRCDCTRRSSCEHERAYADPDATWGWDSYRERYYFGHRLHVVTTHAAGADLPLHLMLDAAHTADAVLGVRALANLGKHLAAELPHSRLHAAIADTGYDATAFYELILEMGAAPIIPLHPNTRPPAETNGIRRAPDGRPLCPGNLPMRFHGHNKRTSKLVYNCPVKRPGRADGKHAMRTYVHDCPLAALCEPDTAMGPLVHIPVGDDPRLNLPIPRNTPAFDALYDQRTATERFFSTVKGNGLGARPYRRRHVFHIITLCHALRLHARAWLAQDHAAGTAPTRIAAEEVKAA
jgi:hypothetical protein